MARPLRIEYPNAFYHVIQRGLEGKAIFSSDSDRRKFLYYLGMAYAGFRAIIHTFVLMKNHYHLILETPRGNLSQIMHYINTSYAIYFNSRRKRHGPLYQGRFKAILVQQDEYLHHLSRYIHLNPVRAGIVQDPLEYPWSSLKYFVTKSVPPEWLNTKFILSMFDKHEQRAKHMYLQFVLDGIGHEKDIIKEKMKGGFVLGDDSFFEEIKERFVYGKKDPEIPLLRRLQKEPSLENIKHLVEQRVESNKRLQRKIAIYLSRKYTQKTLKEIAEFYGKIKYSAVSKSFRRTERKRGDSGELHDLILSLEKGLM
ncbi:MAG: transposase [Candidatus Tritonobacter lacicola]|nr:transposase [Candidatus Tritonobacter lacicola]